MVIGRMNEQVNPIIRVTGLNCEKEPAILEKGNPFKGERLKIWWTHVHSMGGIDIHITMDEGFWLNNLVLTLGEDCIISKISAYNAGKRMKLCEYCGETGQDIRERIVALPVETDACEIILSVEAVHAHIVNIERIDIYGINLSENILFPQVNEYEKTSEEHILAQNLKTISVDCDDALCAAHILCEKFLEQTGVSLSASEKGDIVLLSNKSVEPEGYTITVDSRGVVITASDKRGFVYGSEVFLKMVRIGEIPCVKIKDKPHMQFRGVHVFLPEIAQMDFFKRFIKYVLSPLGYNTVIIELSGAMELKTHPEINAAYEREVAKGLRGEQPPFPHQDVGGGKTVKQEKVRELVEYIHGFGMNAVPEVQSFSHVEYILAAYPELAEMDEEGVPLFLQDGRSDFYKHDYCPSNPRTYEIMFDILGEVLEVFKPCMLVHMGHDELKKIGVCPLCRGKDPSDLYAGDIRKYRDFLKEHGAKMMIWADAVSGKSQLALRTGPAIEKIPKDVILLDFIWYVYEGETEDVLLPYVDNVMVGNLYSSHYKNAERRFLKKGMMGGEVSMWVSTAEEDIAREGKFYDLFYTAQMLWEKNYSSYLRYSYDRLIQRDISFTRPFLQNKRYPSRTSEGTVVVDKGQFDINSPTGGEIEIHGCAASIIFEHTSKEFVFRMPWIPGPTIGGITVTYSDGLTEEIPLKYSENIGYWNRRFSEPLLGSYYRHNGYVGSTWYTSGVEGRLENGQPYTLYKYEWINPYPTKEICKIKYNSESAILNKLTVVNG